MRSRYLRSSDHSHKFRSDRGNMAHIHPTSTWEAMGDGQTFYNKYQLYQMQWEGMYDLSDFVVVGARHGGPIGKSHVNKVSWY